MAQWAGDHVPFPGARVPPDHRAARAQQRARWRARSCSAARRSTSSAIKRPGAQHHRRARPHRPARPPPSRSSTSSARRTAEELRAERRPRRAAGGPQGGQGHAAQHRGLDRRPTARRPDGHPHHRPSEDLDALLDVLRARPRGRAHVLQGARARPRDGRGLADQRPRAPRARLRRRRPVVGYVAVVPLSGLVGPRRRRAAGRRPRRAAHRASAGTLARWALVQAVAARAAQADASRSWPSRSARSRCSSALGFRAEGLLRDHVRDRDGNLRDLVLLSHPVADQWSAMETAGIDDALRAPGG